MEEYDQHAVKHSAMTISSISYGRTFNPRLPDVSAVLSACSNEATIAPSEVAQAPQTSMGAALKTHVL